MEVIVALPLIIIPFFLPLIAGLMAVNFGRKFWPWFFIGLILPFIANIIILCLPNRKKEEPKQKATTTPVSNEEIFDHLLRDKENTHKKQENEVYFSASA